MKSSELLVNRDNGLLDHLSVSLYRGTGQVALEAFPCELQRAAPVGSIELLARWMGAPVAGSRGFFLLCFYRFRLPSSRHTVSIEDALCEASWALLSSILRL